MKLSFFLFITLRHFVNWQRGYDLLIKAVSTHYVIGTPAVFVTLQFAVRLACNVRNSDEHSSSSATNVQQTQQTKLINIQRRRGVRFSLGCTFFAFKLVIDKIY